MKKVEETEKRPTRRVNRGQKKGEERELDRKNRRGRENVVDVSEKRWGMCGPARVIWGSSAVSDLSHQ